MTPPPLDIGVVTRRLRLLADTLDELRGLGAVGVARLETEPVTRAATERFLQVVIDLAVDVNAHLAVGVLGRAPATGRESFELAATAGALDHALAARLGPSAGLRNLLVHRYADLRLDLVAAAIEQVRADFPEYVRQIAEYLRTSAS